MKKRVFLTLVMSTMLSITLVLPCAPAYAQIASHQKISDILGNFNGRLNNSDLFGWVPANIGDFDGDGINELAVGTPGDDDGGIDRGAVWILFLDANGAVKRHQKISDTEGNFDGVLNDGDEFGHSVKLIGDFDNDGVNDIAVGALRDDEGGLDRGALWLLFLNANGTVKSHQKIFDVPGGFIGQPPEENGFGHGIALLGDLDGDRVPDLATGTGHNTETGVIWVLFMNRDGTVKSHQRITEGEGGFTDTVDLDAEFGHDLDALGDLDGDGVVDLAVGLRHHDDGGDDRGGLYVLFLNTDGTVKRHQKISDTAGGFTGILHDGDVFGHPPANAGDLNGDGVTDLLVGAPFDDDGGPDIGAFWILFLNTDGTVRGHEKVSQTQGGFTGDLDAGDLFSHIVTSMGDINGDTLTDFAVGAPHDDDAGVDRGAIWVLFSQGLLNILDVSPAVVAPGGMVQLTAVGTGFQAGAQVQLCINTPGVTINGVNVVDAGTILVDITVPVNAQGGNCGFRVINPDGESATLASAFSIQAGPPPTNQAPSVNAGSNQTITLPNFASLDGTVTDDGLPNPPGSLTTTWSKVSGRGTVTFGNPRAVATTASFSLPGTYVLRLTADDSVLSNSDEVTITVNSAPPINQPPTVNAGPAQTITLPNTATLNGTVTDDGLPDPPGIVATTWTKVSGPGTVTFGNAAAVDTTATFSQADTYVLRLTATDGALTRSAEVTITVNPPWVETVPDIRGLWTEGPVRGFATACQNPADNGPFSDPGGETYRITNQTGASFSVNKVETVVDGRDTVVQATTCAGTVAANGTVTASCTYNVSLNGKFWYNGTSTLTGSLMGNALTYTLAGQDQVGDTCQWTQSGTDTRRGPVPPPVPINRWVIAGIGDLDGNSTADMLWRDTTTGAVAAWFMNGLTVSRSGVLATILPDWVIGGVGDLDNNGTEDVLWRHPSSGTVAAWYMTPGTGAVERGEVLATGLPADWLIGGMGDLDGNGTADVVWRHRPSGLVAAWYMTPGTGAIDSSAVLDTIPPDWVIGGVGDLDNNGTADVLWRHPTTGTVAAWFMTFGTGAVERGEVLATGLPADWLIGDIGDLDDNGTADVVWRHVLSGLVAAWLMTPGTGAVGTSGVISTIPPDWNIAGMGDLNLGNGPADVVWHHPSSGLAAAWLMNGLTVSDSGIIDAP